MRWALTALLVALALSGCESSQERSAKLERVAKRREAQLLAKTEAQRRLLTIAHPSRRVSVTGVTLLKSAEGMAVVVTLRNHSSTAVREVPVRVTVHGADGASVYTNETPGQAPALISASLIPAHSTLRWIDDQVEASGPAQSATAEVGEAPTASGPVPALSVSGAHMIEDPTNGPGAEGEVVNHSGVSQSELVVYAVASKQGRVVAAGRAVLPSAPAGEATHFQLFFIGQPQGAKLEVSAPASTLSR